MEATEVFAVFDHPDPDDLPEIPEGLELAVETAGRVLRGVLTQEAQADSLEERMKADQAAWARLIMAKRERAAQWREMIRAWMVRSDVKQIKTPWFSASIAKGRTKVVVDNEQAAIIGVKTLGAQDKAVKVTEKLIKQEFDALFNARPKIFEGAAHEETSEPSLVVRKAPKE